MYKVKFPNVSIEKKFFKELKDIEPKHLIYSGQYFVKKWLNLIILSSGKCVVLI